MLAHGSAPTSSLPPLLPPLPPSPEVSCASCPASALPRPLSSMALPPSAARGTVWPTNATGANHGSCAACAWKSSGSWRGAMPSLEVDGATSLVGADRRRARRPWRRLSTLCSRSTLTHPTKGAALLAAAEMGQARGQATRRELALGLDWAQRRAWPRHVAVAGGGRAGLAGLNDGGFGVLLVPWICCR